MAIQATVRSSRGGGAGGDFALARYNPDGSLDPSFSGDGKQTTDFVGDRDAATGVALQGDGKIVAVGRAASATPASTASRSPATTPTARWTRASPATASRRPTSASSATTWRPGWRFRATARRSSRWASGDTGGFALARYNFDGSLDTTFSGNGKQLTKLPGAGGATGVALQADGKIVAVGTESGGGDPEAFAVARYNPDGSLDPTFSGDGKQTTDFGPRQRGDRGGASGRRQDRRGRGSRR